MINIVLKNEIFIDRLADIQPESYFPLKHRQIKERVT